jgi:hypothetical protein
VSGPGAFLHQNDETRLKEDNSVFCFPGNAKAGPSRMLQQVTSFRGEKEETRQKNQKNSLKSEKPQNPALRF